MVTLTAPSRSGGALTAHRLIIALLCSLITTIGCSGDGENSTTEPTAVTTVTTSTDPQTIRDVNFGNLEWFDEWSSSTVTLVDGVARREADNDSGGLAWKLTESPRYSDVDGDGHEDAAAVLSVNGDQLGAEAWYIWLWRSGEALQLRRPIAQTFRCDRPIESVTAVPHGFKIQAFMSVSEDNCAGGGSVPITYVAGVRDGWPVRISPYFGPIVSCDPRAQTAVLHPKGLVQLYTWPDVRSPAVEPAARYDELLVEQYTADPTLTPEQEWILGIAVDGSRRVCGMVRADQVRISQK